MEGDDRAILAVDLESPRAISAAERPGGEEEEERREGREASGEEEDFEFAFVPRGSDPGAEFAAYPVFGRDLLLSEDAAGEAVRVPMEKLVLVEERDWSATSSECDEELEGIPEGSYCAWAPRSPDRCRKSSSTGSTGRRWRLRDLVVGRSSSDGNERFVFLGSPDREIRSSAKPSTGTKAKPVEDEKKKGKGGKVTAEVGAVSGLRAYYATKGGQEAKGGRRSFLPYRPELVGFFGTGKTLRRTRHPS